MLIAKYIESDEYKKDERLENNKEYVVTEVDMGSWYTSIYLKEFDANTSFNSVIFKFFDESNKEVDIYNDPRYNPYMRSSKYNPYP